MISNSCVNRWTIPNAVYRERQKPEKGKKNPDSDVNVEKFIFLLLFVFIHFERGHLAVLSVVVQWSNQTAIMLMKHKNILRKENRIYYSGWWNECWLLS